MHPCHELLRWARRIHAVYEQRAAQSCQDQQARWRLLEQCFQQLQQQRHLVEKAQLHGWHLAAGKQQQRLLSLLRVCHDATHATQEIIQPPVRIPLLQELLAELQHLFVEFDVVEINKKQFLAIHTGAIVLEGIDLGRFAIQLHWPRLAQQRADVECFDVVALDPNPSAVNEEVPHPHVKDLRLCAGDATLPLQRALEQGRLADAFCLLRSVLETYNPHSAYVPLKEWEGFACWDCGRTANDEDRCCCESCEHDVCGDCTTSCQQCDAVRCSSCQTRCDECSEPCCRRCLRTSACSDLRCCADCLRSCVDCSAKVACRELDETTDRCLSCQEAFMQASTVPPDNESLPTIPSLAGDSP